MDCNPYNSYGFGGSKRKNNGIEVYKDPETNKRHSECSKCEKKFITKRDGTICPCCQSRINRKKQKEKAVNLKGGKCQICGFDKHIASLEFHHRDPKEKKFTISAFWLRAWSKIEEELNKCDLVCANCHAEIHAKED